MPIPLSGQQRQMLTALTAIKDGKSEEEVARIVKRTYSYLTDADVANVLRDARANIDNAARIGAAADGELVSNHIDGVSTGPYYVASVLAHWKGKSGREYYRTIRVRIPKDATKGQIDMLIKDEIKAVVLAGRKRAEEQNG